MGLANSFANGGLSLANDFGWPGPALPPNQNYANVFGVQDLTELAAIVPPVDKSAATVEDLLAWWYYDAESMAVPDGVTAILPDAGNVLLPGRWVTTPPSSSGILETTGSIAGDTLVYNPDTLQFRNSPTAIPVVFGRSRSSAGNEWLRIADSVPANTSPLVMPSNMRLVGITSATRDNETYDAEVYKNAFVRAGGTPLDANKLTQLVVAAARQGVSGVLAIDLVAGDEIGVYLRGTGVSFPVVTLWFTKRYG